MVTNRVMPRTLFCLRDIHATWVADGTHQNPHWHLHIYPAVPPPRLAALGRRNVSSDCSQEVTACFTSASVANRLVSQLCFKGSIEVEIPGPRCSRRRCLDVAVRLHTAFELAPGDFHLWFTIPSVLTEWKRLLSHIFRTCTMYCIRMINRIDLFFFPVINVSEWYRHLKVTIVYIVQHSPPLFKLYTDCCRTSLNLTPRIWSHGNGILLVYWGF